MGTKIKGALAAMPREFRGCRLERHRFERVAMLEEWQKPGRVFRRSWAHECDRCGLTRIQSFDAYGNLTRHPRYIYPDGYLVKDKKNRPTKAQLRIFEWDEQEHGAIANVTPFRRRAPKKRAAARRRTAVG